MHSEHSKLRKKNHLYKSMLIFSIFVTASIILVFLIVINKFDDTANSIIEQDNNNLFESLVEREDKIDKSAVNMLIGLNQTYHASTLQYTIFDEEEIYRSISTLNLMLKYNIDALESCYICNFTNNRIYLLGSRSRIYSQENFFDRNILKILNISKRQQGVFTITRSFSDENSIEKNVYSYILINNYDSKGRPIDAIVLNISIDDAYKDLISKNTNLAIVDNNKNILKINGEIPADIYTGLFSLEKIPARTTVNGKEYLITTAKLDQNDWVIMSLSPIDILTRPIRMTRYILFGILSVIIVLAILFSYFISSYLYTPIENILKKIPATTDGDEFKAIQSYLKKKDEALDKLNATLSENQPYIKLRFLADLLKSPMEDSALQEAVEKLSFNIPLEGRIRIIRVKIDDRYGFVNSFSSLEQMKLRDSLLKKMLEKLDRYRCEYHYTNDYTTFSIVVSPADEKSEMQTLLAESMASFSNYTGYTISVFLSPSVDRLKDLNIAYAGLSSIEEELFFAEPSSILSSADVKEREIRKGTDLPLKEINEAVLGQKRNDFILLANSAFETIAATDYFSATYLTQTVNLAIISAIKTYQHNSGTNLGLISSEQLDEIQHYTFLSEIKQEITDFGLQAIDVMTSIRSDEKNLLIDGIDEYIKTHYRDINLSSTMIADHFHLTAAYTNKLYRTYSGDSLLNAINNFRLEKAAELLNTTNKTVEEISEEIGWSNVKHFYTKFKSYYGVTPKGWRRTWRLK